ncbi:transcription activator BRG1-like isoform X2 [Sycon ciliatum]|uniref:transcription activator BRG1-like isoform X2 n=1 Tax=Sycon ciliatum TaxID=27933 RepID=UPI0031F705E5
MANAISISLDKLPGLMQALEVMREKGLESDNRYKLLSAVANKLQAEVTKPGVKTETASGDAAPPKSGHTSSPPAPQGSESGSTSNATAAAGAPAPAAANGDAYAALLASVSSNSSIVNIHSVTSSLSPEQVAQLRAQIAAYQLLANKHTLSQELLSATGALTVAFPTPPTASTQATQPPSQQTPTQSLKPQQAQPEQPQKQQQLSPQPVKAEAKSSAKPLSPAAQAARKKPVPQGKPPKLLPSDNPKPLPRALVLKERENILATRMQRRIAFLEEQDEPIRANIQLMTELRALKLLDLQQKVREEVRQEKLDEPGLDAQVQKSSRRSKKQQLRAQEKLQQQRMGHEQHMEFVSAILQHGAEWRIFHRNVSARITKLAKSVLVHYATTEREQKKESDRLEKERIRRLMAEDEEGYRKLIDQQKDKRLAFLLDQTDEFIEQLTDLVKKHKLEQRAMRRRNTLGGVGNDDDVGQDDSLLDVDVDISQDLAKEDDLDMHAPVVEIATGKTLVGVEAPLKSELTTWLHDNPGYRLASPAKRSSRSIDSPGDKGKADGDTGTVSDLDSDLSGDEDSEGSDDGGEEPMADAQGGAVPGTDSAAASATSSDQACALPSGPLGIRRRARRERLRKSREQSDAVKAAVGTMDVVDEYQDSAKPGNSETNKNSTYFRIAHQHKEKITKQPDMLVGGTLKEYQMAGLEWLVSLYNNNLNGILADEMGLGKTIQSIATICYLVEKKNYFGPYLIIVPLSTLSNWAMEFEKWAPAIVKILYKGAPAARKALALKVKTTRYNVLLTTYEYVMKDRNILSKIQWKHMIIDEGHRMKNHHCKLTTTINQHYQTSHRLILSGTPLQNSLPEMWALLNFLLPSIFHSVTTFEQWFNAPFANMAEKVELNKEETMLIIRRLHQVLRPFLLRRLKREVESQLPEKSEYILRCDMSALQKRMYQHMKSKGVILTDGSEQNKKGKGGTKTLMNTIVQLRKICNHPFLFQAMEEAYSEHIGLHGAAIQGPDLFRTSGKFELLDRILPKLYHFGHRVLLFCQMTQCMTVLEDYLAGAGWRYLRLDGATKADDRGQLLSLFNAPESPYFLFLLSTRAGGLGLNLQSADTVIIFDSDWNPHQDLQAQDRAHRIGQKHEVRVLRLITLNSVEEQILQAARYKLNMDEKVIQAGMFDQKSTGVERRAFLEALLFDEEENEEEDDVPDDEVINQMISRGQNELPHFQIMDTERIEREKTGHYWSGKSRLMEDHELPPWLQKDLEEVEKLANEEEEEKLYGTGVRQRTEVDYSEALTDKQWVKAVEDGKLDEAENKMRERKRKHEGDDDAPEVKKPVEKVEKKKAEPKKKKIGRPANKVVPNPPLLTKQMLKIIALIMEYKNEEGRVLSEIFYQLPSPRQLKDYYEIIKTPIDIRRIKDRVLSHRYRSLLDMDNDCQLMFRNARIYNREGSIIYEDSIVLEAVYVDARDSVIRGDVQVSDDEDSSLHAAAAAAAASASAATAAAATAAVATPEQSEAATDT